MYYNLAKTAELLGLNTGDVNRLREQGKLRAFKDGADWKFRKEEVEQYLTKMIKERSAQNSDDGLLASEDDDDKTAFAVDSSAFDAMFDQAGDDLQVSANNDDVVVNDDNGNNDDLQLAPADDDDFKLVDDDDELKLAPEEAPEDANAAYDGTFHAESTEALHVLEQSAQDVIDGLDDVLASLRTRKEGV